MATKLCTSCKLTKPLKGFNRKGDHYQSSCRKCSRAYSQRHYLENKAAYLRRIASRKRELLEFIQSLKEGKPCTDCGNSYHPCAMDFDHLDGSTKVMDLTKMAASYGYCKERLLAEIEKCDLVCAVCHRIRTHNRIHSGVV